MLFPKHSCQQNFAYPQDPRGSLDPYLWDSTFRQSTYPFLAAGPDGSLDGNQGHTAQQREVIFGSAKVPSFSSRRCFYRKQRCEFTAQMTYSHLRTDKKAGVRKCSVGTQQAGPLQRSCSAVLGEGKDTGTPLMFYKARVGNSR